MEAVVWLENYLSNFKKILLLVSHSQDFMNNVCTQTVHMHKRRLDVYGGNYDTVCVPPCWRRPLYPHLCRAWRCIVLL
jgi:ATP-binding cassette subfamily F protein 2